MSKPPGALRRLRAGALSALVAEGGGLASLELTGAQPLELVQHPASAFEPGLVQVWVRDRMSGQAWPALGAGAGTVGDTGPTTLAVVGAADGLRWRVRLALHPGRPAWSWRVSVVNDGPDAREVDLVHTHDLALAQPGAVHANELYVSQYLDVSPLDGPTGVALGVRQNQPQGGRHPWAVLTADVPVAGWATDALAVHGLRGRAGGPVAPYGELPATRLQHEHTLAALATVPALLAPGEQTEVTFAGLVVADHPQPTSGDDGAWAAQALTLAAELTADDTSAVPPARPAAAPSNGYARGRELPTRDLLEAELRERWLEPWRVVERDADGRLMSFFTGDTHVATRVKELAVLRPHGTILRTGDRARPDPTGLTVTAWMTGSPLSYLTRGHVTTGRVLSTVRGYLGLHRAYGLRVFVEGAGAPGWRLLDLPSAFATALDGATWHYRPADGGDPVEVTVSVPADERCVRVTVDLGRAARRVLVALHLAGTADPLPAPLARAEAELDGVVVRVAGEHGPLAVRVGTSVPVVVGDDAPLHDDGLARGDGAVVTLLTDAVPAVELDVAVSDGADTGAQPPVPHAESRGDWWREVTATRLGGHPAAEVVDASLPWLVRDALVHHLSPRGLEQYTGGAWGTRDVTQGPLELLLALDRPADARALLRQVFAAQNPDGSWPQAFGFLPGDEGFRHEPPHGDVVHWPVLALGRALQQWGDPRLLTDQVPWFGGSRPPSSVLDHVLVALDAARGTALPGTHLVAYGHGDWNDSLQPADPAMTSTLTSTWTVTLHHQSLVALADGLEHTEGSWPDLVAALRAEADAVAADLHRHLLVDGELAGYAQLDGGSVTRLLVHPLDTETGLRHGALPMIHALLTGLLGPEEAARHVGLVRTHLTGADGVRLFDVPPGYHGGATRHFQRAETATFVGREIGLMYVHAHLRWVEALAHWGDGAQAWRALRQVLPAAVGVEPDLVPGARCRQATTYASSSDAVVVDRAEFAARYGEVLTGALGFEGGWRTYSSGPGVAVRVLTQALLGVRRRGEQVELDPVLDPALDGLTADVPLDGGVLRLTYRTGEHGRGVRAVHLGERPVPLVPLAHPYRPAGARVALADLVPALTPHGPRVEVHLR